MKKLPLVSLTASLILSACGSAPVQPTQVAAPETRAPAKETRPARVVNKSFSADTLYALLVAELAMGRQRHDIALNNYVQQAEATRDAGIAEHATHLATMLRAPQEALSMAEIWTDVEPHNTEARSLYANNLVRAKRFDEAFEQARRLIEAGETAAFENLAANAAEGGPEQAAALATKYENLLQSHPDNVSLLVGYSLLQEQLQQPEASLETIRRAISIEPDSVSALYQESRLLQLLGRDAEAMDKMGTLVAKNPGNHRLRLRYARALVDSDIQKAHEQYLILQKQLPFDQDVLFTLALIERELQRFDDAIQRFNTLIERQQHVLSSHYQLGKIYEDQLRPDKALPHYLEVNSGSNHIAALSHAVRLMLSEERHEDALLLIRSRRANLDPGQQDRAYMLEADILNKRGQVRAAEEVLTEGLLQMPASANLLYARALLYSNIDSIEAAEKDFKAILAIKPDDAATLNALGYTLADKTDRLDEAQEFIARALAITPNDAAVLDSMGWLHYRKGNYEAALDKLRQAMAAMPDHEIAAHLGEVLWVTGVQDEARQVWRSGLELNPDSKIIKKTLDRLNATLH